MGRKYVRDNKGRFASTGATARGGRLKTAAGNKRETVTAQFKAQPSGVIGRGGNSKPIPNPQASTKARFDREAWQRRAQRVKNVGLARANKESGSANFEKEYGKVQRAYANQFKAERFYAGLTKSKSDPTGRTLVKGPVELMANFQSRPRLSTSSTSRGVAARNRIYDQERKATQAANKARRVAAAAKPKVNKAPKLIQTQKRTGVIRPGTAQGNPKNTKVLQTFLKDLPTVPTGRKPDYVGTLPGGKTRTYYLSNEAPRRATAKQINQLFSATSGQAWSRRSNSLGDVQKLSRTFSGTRGASETVQITVSRKGGPLAGGFVEVNRSVTSRGGRRGGGSIVEQQMGLPRKPRLNSKPRRRP